MCRTCTVGYAGRIHAVPLQPQCVATFSVIGEVSRLLTLRGVLLSLIPAYILILIRTYCL